MLRDLRNHASVHRVQDLPRTVWPVRVRQRELEHLSLYCEPPAFICHAFSFFDDLEVIIEKLLLINGRLNDPDFFLQVGKLPSHVADV